MFLRAENLFVLKIFVLLPILSPFGLCRPGQLHHSPHFLPVPTLYLVVVISIVFIFFSSDGTAVQCETSPQSTSPSHLCFWPLFPICNFAFINICLYIVPPSIFWSSSYSSSTSLRISAKYLTYSLLLSFLLTLILRRSRTGTVWFYTSTSNKRAARPKLYTESLTSLCIVASHWWEFPLNFRHRASCI